ncbi:MAG TPA: GtrA family protein [Rhodanobacteraceae bacterium]
MPGPRAPATRSGLVSLADRKLFIGFVMASGFAALVNIATRIVFNRWMPFSASIVAAYVCGMITAFTLNRLFVFRETVNPFHRQAFWFVMVNVAAVIQTLIVSLVLARWVLPTIGFHWHVDTVAHVCGVVEPLITSFIGHKHFTFRKA